MPGNKIFLTLTSAEHAQLEKWLDAVEVPRHCEFECHCDLLFYKTATYADGATIELTFHAGSVHMSPHAEISVYTRDGYPVSNSIIGPEGVLGLYGFKARRGEYNVHVFVDDLPANQAE